ncbi:uncharacterized protein LOC126735311 isoform X2 [Anthonomus grandis grandis]|nr:uncharacterized protein LOC126735311 isoform X2 [Anthonomus grandis grandis]
MALVSYDYGSDSEGNITDEEDEVTTSQVILAPKSTEPEPVISSTTSSIFSQLPQAKSHEPEGKLEEENDKLEDFIPTVKTIKEKKKIQIAIPSLSEFADLDDNEPVKKKAKPSAKGSGLLGILPPIQSAPKLTNTMFIPNSLTKKTKPTPKPIKSRPVNTVKKTHTGSDSDTDTEDVPVPETFDDEMWQKVCGRSANKPKNRPKQTVQLDVTPKAEQETYTSAPSTHEPYDGLDNEAFKELVGKTKRPIGNIKLIDINEDEILPDRDLWMTKSLTDPDLAPKPSEDDDQMDPTKKRKHHITYLAQKAKANEQELKAAWATSKNNRMMSRAKYGF